MPTADVTPVDAEFAARLRTVDDAPVTGPRPLAVTPYRLALARRGNRYAEAVVRGVAEGAAVRYTVDVRPTSGAPVTLGPYSVVAAVPEFTPGDVVGGRFGDLVDAGPAWVGHVRRGDGLTHVRVDLDDIPADGSLPVRVRIGGTWLSADYLTAPSNPDGRLPLLDWAADTVTFSGPDPDGAPVEFDVGGRRVAEADAGGPGRARLLIAHFCIQAINDLLEEPFDGYVPPRTYMQVTMADEDGPYSSRPGAERINPGGYRDGLTMHRRFGVPYHLALNGGVLVLTAHDCPDDLAALRADLDAGLMHPAIAGYGSHRIPYYSAEANVRDITAGVEAITTYLGASARPPDVFYPDQRLYRQRPATVAALQHRPRPLRRARLGHRLLRQRRLRRAVRRGLRPRARDAVDRPRERRARAVHRHHAEGPGARRQPRPDPARAVEAAARGATAVPAPGARPAPARAHPAHLRRRLREGLRQRLVRAGARPA